MHIPFDPILGFSTAGFSTAALWLAQTADQVVPGVKGWIEVGGTIGLIAGLSYGCTTLWKEVQKQKQEIAQLNKEVREDWKKQNDRLISALDKIDPQ
jgi:hypothetical protein